MAKRAKKRTQTRKVKGSCPRLDSPPETHKSKAGHAFMDASHHANLAREAIRRGRCSDALHELLTARGALEEGNAHAESDGATHALKAQMASTSVKRTEDRFKDGCLVKG